MKTKKTLLSILLALCMALTLLPATALAADKPADGWYNLRCMNMYFNLNALGYLELRGVSKESFYVESRGDGKVSLRMADGTYLGLKDGMGQGIKDGFNLQALGSVYVANEPYVWNIRSEKGADIFSLRPSEAPSMLVNADGQKKDNGTRIIVWTHENLDAPNHAEIRFIPTTAPAPVTPDPVIRNWKNTWEDWVKPITREDMAVLLVEYTMTQMHGAWVVKFSLPGAFTGADGLEFSDVKGSADNIYWFQIGRLLYWGVVPIGDGKFYPNAGVTYGEFTDTLIKLMAYDKKQGTQGAGPDWIKGYPNFTRATIDSFNVGGDTSANAKITMRQATILCEKTVHWMASHPVYGGTCDYCFYDTHSAGYFGVDSASSAAPTPAKPTIDTLKAKPTNTAFMLNGAEVSLPAYLIGGNNYVKLRDIAALLKTRFDVRWEDGEAKLFNFAAYTPVGGELAAIGTDNKSAKLSGTVFAVHDKWDEWTGNADLTAYNIGGNNYIGLREIAKLFDFDVDWRDGKAWIEPDVSPYTED